MSNKVTNYNDYIQDMIDEDYYKRIIEENEEYIVNEVYRRMTEYDLVSTQNPSVSLISIVRIMADVVNIFENHKGKNGNYFYNKNYFDEIVEYRFPRIHDITKRLRNEMTSSNDLFSISNDDNVYIIMKEYRESLERSLMGQNYVGKIVKSVFNRFMEDDGMVDHIIVSYISSLNYIPKDGSGINDYGSPFQLDGFKAHPVSENDLLILLAFIKYEYNADLNIIEKFKKFRSNTNIYKDILSPLCIKSLDIDVDHFLSEIGFDDVYNTKNFGKNLQTSKYESRKFTFNNLAQGNIYKYTAESRYFDCDIERIENIKPLKIMNNSHSSISYINKVYQGLSIIKDENVLSSYINYMYRFFSTRFHYINEKVQLMSMILINLYDDNTTRLNYDKVMKCLEGAISIPDEVKHLIKFYCKCSIIGRVTDEEIQNEMILELYDDPKLLYFISNNKNTAKGLVDIILTTKYSYVVIVEKSARLGECKTYEPIIDSYEDIKNPIDKRTQMLEYLYYRYLEDNEDIKEFSMETLRTLFKLISPIIRIEDPTLMETIFLMNVKNKDVIMERYNMRKSNLDIKEEDMDYNNSEIPRYVFLNNMDNEDVYKYLSMFISEVYIPDTATIDRALSNKDSVMNTPLYIKNVIVDKKSGTYNNIKAELSYTRKENHFIIDDPLSLYMYEKKTNDTYVTNVVNNDLSDIFEL